MPDACPYENEHPAIAAEIDNLKVRLNNLEHAEANRGKIRADDMKEFRENMKEVNEKITKLMVQLAGLNGKLAAAVFFGSGLGALGMFALAKLFDLGGKS